MRGLGYRVFSLLVCVLASEHAWAFGTDGFFQTTFFGIFEQSQRILVAPDHSLTLVGFTFNNKKFSFQSALARVTPEGNADLTFGAQGKQVLSLPGSSNDFPVVARLAADGKMWVAGGSFIGEDADFMVARLLPNGALDPSFAKTGGLTLDINFGSSDFVGGLDLQPDGKVVLVGTTTTNNDTFDIAVVRLMPDGTLDPVFGDGGMKILSVGKRKTSPLAIFLQKDGTFIIPGTGEDSVWFVGLDTQGQLNPAFGVNGVSQVQLAGTTATTFVSATAQPDGKILFAGNTKVSNNPGFLVARFLPNGTIDSAFGTNGAQILTLVEGASSLARSVAIANDGKIFVAASVTDKTRRELALVGLLPNGSLDETFGEKGKVITAIKDRNLDPQGIELQSDGKILFLGDSAETNQPNLAPTQFLLARFLPNGTLDTK